MNGTFDHSAFVARDLDEGIATLSRAYGLEVERRVELEQFSLRGAFLSGATPRVEVVTFTDPAVLDARLGSDRLRHDHVAYVVADIDAAVAELTAVGARLCGPDRSPLDGPIALGPNRSVWTLPDADDAVCVQLIEQG